MSFTQALLVAAGSAAMTPAPLAPRLSVSPLNPGPAAWHAPDLATTLRKLASARPTERQAARWQHARALLGAGKSADAHGVLQVMAQDERDLALAAPFRLAMGRTLVELRRGAEAVAALDMPQLATNAEACAWRLMAYFRAGAPQLAVQQLGCAKPALSARAGAARAPFIIAAAEAALESGDADTALDWLRFAPSNAAGRLVQGRALLSRKRPADAARVFEEIVKEGTAEQQAAASLGLVQARLSGRQLGGPAALKQLAEHRYRWRGGAIERDNLFLSFSLARKTGDDATALGVAASLVRYHAPGAGLAPLLTQCHALFATMLDPTSRTPLPRAAGLYWEYRDLAPGGLEGDLLALRLAERLQAAGLYQRAAGLLEHQLLTRARDLAQGPLSVRVAKLHVLAGDPQKALDALRLTAAIEYPAAMHHERLRVEAIALQQLGRGGEALAVLADVPGSGALQAELLWKQRSWAALAAMSQANLPPAGALSEVRQAMVLRHAITLGMLGREAELAKVRARYTAAFAELRTSKVFDLLTRPASEIQADQLTEAMAAIPTVSPAGEYADLLDAAPLPAKRS